MPDGSVRMSILQKVSFEKHRQESRQQGIDARRKQIQFWTELLNKQPDIGKLHRIGGEINDSIIKAETSYAQLLRINNKSVAVLRGYAQFLLDVVNHDTKAEHFLQEADRIENEDHRLQREKQSASLSFMSTDVHIDMSSENVGILLVSESEETLGKILSMNAPALKAFGYSEQEVIGRPMNILLPEPIASMHDMFLQKYLETGEEVLVSNSYLQLNSAWSSPQW